MRSVGLDVGKNKYCFCEVAGGACVRRGTSRSLDELKEVLGPDTQPARVGIEACREAWHIASVLEQWGHEVQLIDTTRARQLGIGAHGRKNDRIDAEVIGVAVEARRIPLAHMLTLSRQQMRYELGVRRALVETRAGYIVHVRHVARSHGVSLPTCNAGHFTANMKAVELSVELKALVAPMLTLIEQLDVQIHGVDAKLIAVAEREPVVRLLMTVPGVAVIVAIAFVSVIDEAGRFRNAHQVEAYLGLVPSEYASGCTRRIGSITKQGNSYARLLLVEAGLNILQRAKAGDPLAMWGAAIRERRGLKVATVAVARRLAGLLWAMWRDDTVYDPSRLALAEARGVRREAQKLELRNAALLRAAKKLATRARHATKLSIHEVA